MGRLFVYLAPCIFMLASARAQWVATGLDVGTGSIHDLHVDGNFILAKSGQGFLPTYDHGSNWSYLPSPVDSDFFTMTWVGTELIMASTRINFYYAPAIWRSPDSAKTWSQLANPPDSLKDEFTYIYSLFGCGRYLVVGVGGSIFRSADRGNTWIRSKLPADAYGDFTAFAFSGARLYAASGAITLVSADSGATWAQRSISSSFFGSVKTMVGNGKSLLISGAFIYRLGELDTSWSQIMRFDAAMASDRALVSRGSDFLTSRGDTVFRSSDEGISWSPIGRVGASIRSLANDGNALLAGTEGGGIYRSADGGANWTRLKVPDANIKSLSARGGNLYAEMSGGGGLYRSEDRGANWVKALAWSQDNGLGTALADGFNLVGNGRKLYAIGSALGELQRSLDGGLTWESNGSGYKRLWQSGTIFYAEKWQDLYKYPLHRSVDSGSTWIPISEHPMGDLLLSMGPLLITANAASSSRSHDGGAYWEQFPVNLDQVKALAACGNDVFAASSVGLARSSDSASTWGLVRPDMTDITALYSDGSVLFAGRSPANPALPDQHDPMGSRILRSTDQGVTWMPVGEGFIPAAVTSLEVNGTDLYAGTGGAGVWKRPLSELAPGVNSLAHGNPREVSPEKRMLMGTSSKARAMRLGIPLRDLSGRLIHPHQPGSRGSATGGRAVPGQPLFTGHAASK